MDDSAAAVEDAEMDPSMADATMDVAMMEDVPEMADEAPAAPSVALSGSAKMGVKRVDNNMATDPDADNLKTVVEYEVVFSSSGVTDGGLMFGASISIDEEGKGAGTANGVNQASAYIGASDGSWKLTFGDNDPGIDLVGNIGLADADAISGNTVMIEPINYTVGTGTSAVMRPLKLPGMSGPLSTSLATGYTVDVDDAGGIILVDNFNGAIAGYFTTGTTDEVAAVSSGKAISTSKGITVTLMQGDGTAAANPSASPDTSFDFVITGEPTATPERTTARLDGKFGSFTFALTSGESGDNAWSLGTKFDAGVVSVRLGVDSNDVLAAGVEGTFAGNTISGTYVRQSGDDYNGITLGGTVSAPTVYAQAISANEWTAIGVKFKRDLGSGTSIALAYSKKDDKRKGQRIPEDSNQIELDFEYGLGGGATFYAGIERLSKDMPDLRTGTTDLDDLVKSTEKTTTLEAGIKMAF